MYFQSLPRSHKDGMGLQSNLSLFSQFLSLTKAPFFFMAQMTAVASRVLSVYFTMHLLNNSFSTTLQVLCSCAQISPYPVLKPLRSIALCSSQKYVSPCHGHLSPLETCRFLCLRTRISFLQHFPLWAQTLMLEKYHLLS